MTEGTQSSVTYLQTRVFAPPDEAVAVLKAIGDAGEAMSEAGKQSGLSVSPGWPGIGRPAIWPDSGSSSGGLSFIELVMKLDQVSVVVPPGDVGTARPALAGTGHLSIALSVFGFAVLSLSVRPVTDLDGPEMVEWLAQFIRLEQQIEPSDDRAPRAAWELPVLAVDGRAEPVEGGARDALRAIYRKLIGKEGNGLLAQLVRSGTHVPGDWRLHGWGIEPPAQPRDRAFWDPVTYGVHVSVARVGETPAERRAVLDGVRARVADLHGGPRFHVNIDQEMYDETWVFGEFSTYVFDGGVEPLPDPADGQPAHQGAVEQRCGLRFSMVLALKKGLLNSVARATDRAILHNEPLSPKGHVRYWRWLVALSQLSYLQGWDRGRLIELVDATESSRGFQGLRSLQDEVEANLEALSQRSDQRISRSLTMLAAVVGTASLAVPGVELLTSDHGGPLLRSLGAVLVLLALVFLVSVTIFGREKQIHPRS